MERKEPNIPYTRRIIDNVAYRAYNAEDWLQAKDKERIVGILERGKPNGKTTQKP